MPGLSGAPPRLGSRVGDRAADVERPRAGQFGPWVVDVRDSGSWKFMIRADLRVAALGHLLFAEPRVEPLRDVAHQLDVLALIVADRDVGSSVREHVGCHEHGVKNRPAGHQLALLFGLLLELVHPVEIAVGRHRAQQPGQLGVLMDVGLPEEDAAVGVEPCCEQDRGRVVEALPRADRPGRGPP